MHAVPAEVVHDEEGVVQVLQLLDVGPSLGREHVAAEAVAVHLERQCRATRQPHHLHVHRDVALRKHNEVSDVQHTSNVYKVFQDVLLSYLKTNIERI